MKNWTYKALGVGGMLLCSSLATGCLFVDDNDDDGGGGSDLGTLTLQWTIDGQTNPDDCAAFGVDRMELVLYESGDYVVDEVEPLCEAFSVSVDLLDGVYYGDVTLVDSFDRSATTTLPVDDIDIRAGTELVIPVDFSIDSFL